MRVAIRVENGQMVEVCSDRDLKLFILNSTTLGTRLIECKTGGVDGMLDRFATQVQLAEEAKKTEGSTTEPEKIPEGSAQG